LAIPQRRIELGIGQLNRVVLRRQNGKPVARVRPQHGKCGTAYHHDRQYKTNPRAFHLESRSYRIP
jgi:hypothetical protein